MQLGLDRDRPPVRAHDAAADRQAQPAARHVLLAHNARIERKGLAKPRGGFRRHPRAGIGDRNLNVRYIVQYGPSRTDSNHAVAGVFLRIAEQVQDQAVPYDGIDYTVLRADMRRIFDMLVSTGTNLETARQRIRTMEPFNRYPDLIREL